MIAPRGKDLLSDREMACLREIAGRALAAAVSDQESPDPREIAESMEVAWEPRLGAERGAFVTLTRHGALRGCIGHVEGHLPLGETVARNARAAALEDPRFPDVTPAELGDIELEVSALTPLVEVPDPDDIVIGRHGILLEKGNRRAVFLPQVAPEQGWDLAATLGHLALKAGLGPSDWQEGARLLVFEAEVF